MPELPDIAAYIAALHERVLGQPLLRISIARPFVLRTAEPPLAKVAGRVVRELRRVGKRIAIGLDGDYWIVLHLMIAGRLQWHSGGAGARSRATLAVLDFPDMLSRPVLRWWDRTFPLVLGDAVNFLGPESPPVRLVPERFLR